MENLPRQFDWNEEPRPPAEDPATAELETGQARRIIEGGIAAAEAAGQRVDGWVARHIALQLRDEDGSGLDVFAGSGEVTPDLRAEIRRAYIQLPTQQRVGRWLEVLDDYAEHRDDRGPIDGWFERAIARDRFDTAWRDRDRQQGDLYSEGRELDREIRLAQETRVVIGDELAMRLLVRLASSPHSAVARFAADGQVTDELGQELQERYLSGTDTAAVDRNLD